jgi:glycosyltransferase involved in cell wall biosynthesis
MMVNSYKKKAEPLVSVLLPTYNRRSCLPAALSSVVHQNYGNLEIFVIRDGGENVSDIIDSFNDRRIVFIDRQDNRGKAFSLNQALSHSKGKYIAYIDDDDLYYPNHIETLVNVLENNNDCQVAYSDLYRTYCRIRPDGGREVLSKVLDISRDFDRFFMLCFNHTLHVSLMHTREILEKTGFFNEKLNILIDWDLTRRLAFFSDFFHVHKITGEFYHPVGDSGRISVRYRKDRDIYTKNYLEILTTRPPKPWPKVKDMSIILTVDGMNGRIKDTLFSIWQHTFYPYRVYLPLQQPEINKLDINMPNIITVQVDSNMSEESCIDTVLTGCDGDVVAVVPVGFPIRNFWVEDSLYALISSSATRQAFELEDSTDNLRAVVLNKQDLDYARGKFAHLRLQQSLNAAGITIRRVLADEIPFQFDQLLQQAKSAGRDGNWRKAARTFEYIVKHYQNGLWIKAQAAEAFFKAGLFNQAAELVRQVNQQQPTVNTLLLEAKLHRKKDDYKSAIESLKRAEQILEFPSGQMCQNDPLFKEKNQYGCYTKQC